MACGKPGTAQGGAWLVGVQGVRRVVPGVILASRRPNIWFAEQQFASVWFAEVFLGVLELNGRIAPMAVIPGHLAVTRMQTFDQAW